MIVRHIYSFQEGRFRKGTVRISKLSREIMKGMSNIIFPVMSCMDGDFNNSKAFIIPFRSRVIKPSLREIIFTGAVHVIVQSGFQSFFAKSCKVNQILFSR